MAREGADYLATLLETHDFHNPAALPELMHMLGVDPALASCLPEHCGYVTAAVYLGVPCAAGLGSAMGSSLRSCVSRACRVMYAESDYVDSIRRRQDTSYATDMYGRLPYMQQANHRELICIIWPGLRLGSSTSRRGGTKRPYRATREPWRHTPIAQRLLSRGAHCVWHDE
jgi:hypothetical protein